MLCLRRLKNSASAFANSAIPTPVVPGNEPVGRLDVARSARTSRATSDMRPRWLRSCPITRWLKFRHISLQRFVLFALRHLYLLQCLTDPSSGILRRRCLRRHFLFKSPCRFASRATLRFLQISWFSTFAVYPHIISAISRGRLPFLLVGLRPWFSSTPYSAGFYFC